MILMENKKGILINLAIVAAIVAGYLAVTFSTTSAPPKIMSFEGPGMKSPLVPLNAEASVGGVSQKHPITIDAFRGHNVLINFWASWCTACDAEEANIEQLARKYAGSSVEVVGIATSETLDEIKKSGKLQEMHYPQYLDVSAGLAQALKIDTLPQTLLVSSDGRILEHFSRAVDARLAEALDQQMAQLNRKADSFGSVPKFELMSSLGRPIGNQDLAGKLWVADFIFTSCPDECPLITSKMREIQREFRGNDRVKLVSITVDPSHDTPSVLKQYQAKWGANSNQWYFLTGKMDAIKKLLVNGLKLGTPDNPELHTTRLVLVDGLGRIRGYYDGTSTQSLAELKTKIHQLLN